MCAFLHGHFSLTDLPSACVPMSGLFLQFLGSLWRALGTGLVPGPSYRGVGLSFPPLRVFLVPCFYGFRTGGLVVLLPPSGSLHPWMVIGCAVVRLLFLSSSPLVGCLSYPFSRLPFGPLYLSLRLRVFLLGFPVSLGIFDWLSCQQFPLARPPCISVPGSCMAVFDCLSFRRRACIFTLRLVSRRLVGWFVCCVGSGLRLCCWFSSLLLLYPVVAVLPLIFSASGFRVTCLAGMGFPLLWVLRGRIAGLCGLGLSPTGLALRGSRLTRCLMSGLTVRFLMGSPGGWCLVLTVAHWVFGLVCSHCLFLGPRLLNCCLDSLH